MLVLKDSVLLQRSLRSRSFSKRKNLLGEDWSLFDHCNGKIKSSDHFTDIFKLATKTKHYFIVVGCMYIIVMKLTSFQGSILEEHISSVFLRTYM